MRNLLALFGFMVLVFAVAGYFRGWYSFDIKGGDQSGNIQIQGSINAKKGIEDTSAAIKTGVEAVGDLVEKARTKKEDTSPTAPAAPKPNSPFPIKN